jgi:hypothetical protein
MLRNMGCPLKWTLAEPVIQGEDVEAQDMARRFQVKLSLMKQSCDTFLEGN